jgi:hypothetical protein
VLEGAVGHIANGINGLDRALASNRREAIQEFPGPEWRMDSTGCLVGSDAPHFDLPLQFIPARQRNMEEDNPITRHLKLEGSFVAARLCLFRLREEGTHAGVRHVGLNRDLRPCNWFTAGIRQLQNHRRRTDPDWFRRDLMLNRDQS